MKVKVGTTLDSSLYDQVLQEARERGLRVNEVFEAALRAYLNSSNSGADYVAESFGSYSVPDQDFEEIIESDIYEAKGSPRVRGSPSMPTLCSTISPAALNSVPFATFKPSTSLA